MERDRDGSVIFRHADGAAYGDATAPRRVDALALVFSALRHLGFREGVVKACWPIVRIALAPSAPVRIGELSRQGPKRDKFNVRDGLNRSGDR